MPLSTDQREQVANELKKFATDLSLSDDQKNRLRGMLEQQKKKSRRTERRTRMHRLPTS